MAWKAQPAEIYQLKVTLVFNLNHINENLRALL
jgi:hypothetical protein